MAKAYHISLKDLIKGIEEGKYIIPEIQRTFIWDNQKVLDLCESILNGFPIGSLTLWKIPQMLRGSIEDISKPIASGYFKLENVEYMIIDGLQRLLSILLLYKGEIEIIENGKTRKRKNTVCFDPRTKRLYRVSNPRKEKWLFPTHEILNRTPSDLIKEKESLGFRYLESEKEIIQKELNNFRDMFVSYNLGIYEVDWSGEIFDVFEKVSKCFTLLNTKGVRVKMPAIFIALLTGRARRHGVSFRKSCLDAINEFERKGWDTVDEFVFARTYILIATGKPDFRSALKDLENVEIEKINEWYENTVNALKDVIAVLDENYIKSEYIRTKYLLVPLAYLAYLKGINNNDFEKIIQWLILASFEGRYLSQFEIYFSKDIKAIEQNGIDGLLDALELKKLNENVIFEREFSIAHKLLLYYLYIKTNARDWILGIEKPKMIRNLSKIEVHHIFPDKPSHPCNITLISDKANKEIGNKKPEEYLKKLKVKDKRGCLDAHFIPSNEEYWRDYDKFLEERKKLIMEAIKDILPSII